MDMGIEWKRTVLSFSGFLVTWWRKLHGSSRRRERMTVVEDVDAFVGLLVLKYLQFEDYELSLMLPAVITSSFVQFNGSTIQCLVWWRKNCTRKYRSVSRSIPRVTSKHCQKNNIHIIIYKNHSHIKNHIIISSYTHLITIQRWN